MANIDISNLGECVNEVRQAAMDTDPGPVDPVQYHALLGRLTTSIASLPPLYRQTFAEPFRQMLLEIGETGFNQLLLSDPLRQRGAGLMMDLAHAILQNGEGYESRATDAFQEVASDLYDGYLGAADRAGINPPDRGVIAPLVKWGRPRFGPYTWTIDATSVFGCEAAVISLPPTNARRGLLAWSALPHEGCGHDILAADTGLKAQISLAVRQALLAVPETASLATYWSERIDETASDVLGILNMGPAAGIGLIGYFRGLDLAGGGPGKLRNEGPAEDSHPADLVRGYLAAETVRLLGFAGAAAWGDLIETETDKDHQSIKLGNATVSLAKAKASARITANAIVNTPLPAIENSTFGAIQNWVDEDEDIVAQLRVLLGVASPLPDELAEGVFAAHLVAAGTVAALSANASIPLIFGRMLDLLKQMHDGNASWGPLFVRHQGTLTAHRAYVPRTTGVRVVGKLLRRA